MVVPPARLRKYIQSGIELNFNELQWDEDVCPGSSQPIAIWGPICCESPHEKTAIPSSVMSRLKSTAQHVSKTVCSKPFDIWPISWLSEEQAKNTLTKLESKTWHATAARSKHTHTACGKKLVGGIPKFRIHLRVLLLSANRCCSLPAVSRW